MKGSILLVLVAILTAPFALAQESSAEQEIRDLSKAKWQWMADKDADRLDSLFHEGARFVHMGGTWGKEAEVGIIRSGRIHYKKADVHEVAVEVSGDTAVLWNRITLLAVVGGNEVTNPFTVTEVYQRSGDSWQMLALTFSSVMDGHSIR
ncbi:MAG: nuclear transport factor 2 family protein [Rhodothermales bacterium]|nr:nuclear transport factor 2 family protein [Rhodothermales bacterium]